MDPLFKVVSFCVGLVTLLGGVLTLGRILQSLDDLKKKVDTSLDPEGGILKELRDRTHKSASTDQDLINRIDILRRDCEAKQRETEKELVSIRREIHVDDQLSEIKTMIRRMTPMRGLPKPSDSGIDPERE